MWLKLKRTILLCFIIAFLGGVIGGITWSLLFVMNLGPDQCRFAKTFGGCVTPAHLLSH